MNIKNLYSAEHIKVLDGLDAVRKRPSMYIGNTSFEGFHHLVLEVVDNSIDESLAGYCDKINIIINLDKSITIEDNGRGIPVDIHPIENISALELVMTTLHAGGKFDNNSYKVSGGLHGVGISVVNALSSKLHAVIKRDGKIYEQFFSQGVKISDIHICGDTNETGTKITFYPDAEIFTETDEFDYEFIKRRVQELCFLNSNIEISLKDLRSGEYEKFHYEGGIPSYIQYLNRKKDTIHSEPIYIEYFKDQIFVSVSFQYYSGYSERIFSYVNNIFTKDGGTHVSAFKSALTKCINKYATDDIVPKHLREKMSGDDVREGLTCVISIRIPNPQFEGQTKTKLGNSDVRTVVESVVNEKLSIYLEHHPDVAKKILQKVVETARAREAARKAKELSRKKEGLHLLMAGKLAECQEKNPQFRELFIVEGDSAGGSAKQGRDRKFQAVLPLRGKIMNVEKARFEKLLGSEEIKQIISALGTGIGEENFDKNKLRYHKIIIMTDADVDGAHIRTLLLTFFYRQMKSLIDGGYIYIGQTPLYRLSKGKKEVYFKNDDAFNVYVFEKASELFSVFMVCDNNIMNLIAENEIIIYLRATQNFMLSIAALERINYNNKIINILLENNVYSADQFDDIKFVNNLSNNMIKNGFIVREVVESSIRNNSYEFDVSMSSTLSNFSVVGFQLPLMNEYRNLLKFYKEIKILFNYNFVLKRNEEVILSNIKWIELFNFVRVNTTNGYILQRYKGLGEMNPEQLWSTTMNPVLRSLIKVTIKDNEIADDIFSTLMGDDVEPRREFIQQHALEVALLDI